MRRGKRAANRDWASYPPGPGAFISHAIAILLQTEIELEQHLQAGHTFHSPFPICVYTSNDTH